MVTELVRGGGGVTKNPTQAKKLLGGKLHRTRRVSDARGFWQKIKKFNQMSFGLTGPDGHLWVRIGTRTHLDPREGSSAPTGQFPDPHPMGAKSVGTCPTGADYHL
jgi:hypothetical protein